HLTKIHWHHFLVASIIIFCVLFLLTLYWFVFLSNFFQIKNIEIRGLDNVKKIEQDVDNYFIHKNQKFVPPWLEQILTRYLQINIGHNNMLFFSNKELAATLMNKYPEFALVTSKLNVQHNNLVINVVPREISYLVCRKENECFFMDKEGILFREAPQTSGSLINTIFIQNFTPTLGASLFTPDDLTILNNIFLAANKENSPLSVKLIELESPRASTIKIISNNDWYLLINFNSDLDNIVQILNGLFSGELKNKEAQLKYIDCRYLPRVYYYLK
ncbi:MAG: hypothetical protein GYA31_03020, partial [Parcubacteria group bacterium]|nr:hypothetical protein [Parcubacteria group bacterium]